MRNIKERQNRIQREEGFEQSVGAVKKGAMVVKDKTGHITQEGMLQLAALENRSKQTIKKIFKKAA